MLEVLRITEPANLNLITNVIHDRWFDLEDVTFDVEARTVRVPLRPDWLLEISEAEECDIKESEGVGIYDVNEVMFSETDRMVTVATGIPLLFRVTVSGLDVSLSELPEARPLQESG